MNQKKEDSPLFQAITRNDSVNDILSIIDRDPSAARQRGTNWNYPLHQACLHNSHDLIIMKLLDLFPQAAKERQMSGYGANRYSSEIGTFYPLNIAWPTLSDDIILKLIDLNPDAAKINKGLYYPLHMAFYHNRSDRVIMRLLEVYPEAAAIKSMSYDQEKYEDDMYPLHIACKNGLSEVVIQKLLEIYPRALYERSTRLVPYDTPGDYPLDWAIRCNPDVIKLLVTTDPSILQKVDDYDGYTSFHLACCWTKAEAVKCFLQFPNLPINKRRYSGNTPLSAACMSKGQEIEAVVGMLLEYPDVDVNAIYDRGESILHSIILRGKFNLVHLLLNHPCIRIDQRDNENQTPLDLINKQIIELTNCDDNNYNNTSSLPFLMETRNLLQDFPTKRKWQSYEYFYHHLEDWSSHKTMKM